jgi:hypothetical protein
MHAMSFHGMQQGQLLPGSARATARLPFTAASRTAHRQSCACQGRADRDAGVAISPVQRAMSAAGTVLSAAAISAMLLTGGASARLEGVSKPELLPKQYTPVIDVAGFLTEGEEKRLRAEVEHLEEDTGIKLRVLCQNYPQTPGLAIKDFWGVDANTIVFVADPSLGNILNFNVGSNVDLEVGVPSRFWSSLSGKYGNKFYWQDNGQEAAIVNAVSAIDSCIREPQGRGKCAKVQEPMDNAQF